MEEPIYDKENLIKIGDKLNCFLNSICHPLFSISNDEFYHFLHQEKNQEAVQQFLLNNLYRIMVIQKDSQPLKVTITNQIMPQISEKHTILFIKRIIPLQIDIPQCLQIMTLGQNQQQSNPFEFSQNYIQNCFLPIFNAYKNEGNSGSISQINKQLNELNRSLIQCQQGIDVPEITFENNPLIIKFCKQIKEKYNRKPQQNDIENFTNEKQFINDLCAQIMSWIQDIFVLTDINWDIIQGNDTQSEIKYWQSFERSLERLNKQIYSDEVIYFLKIQTTLDILKFNKKHQVITAFEDIQFKNLYQKCILINNLILQFPINDFQNANTLITIKEVNNLIQSIKNIIIFMQKLHLEPNYPALRLNMLIQIFSKDVSLQILNILKQEQIMDISYNEFLKIQQNLTEIFQQIQNLHFQIQKDKNNQLICKEYEEIKKRLERIFKLREQHEKIKKVIEKILYLDKKKDQYSLNFYKQLDVQQAYKVFEKKQVLDLSQQGSYSFLNSIKLYDTQLEFIEKNIIIKLRDKLGAATSTKEMFNIFDNFSSLFFREKIKNAVVEYQTQLLEKVEISIEILKKKLKKTYCQSQINRVCLMRDSSNFSGQIVWIQQIKRNLAKYIREMEKVLGPEWQKNTKGAEIFKNAKHFEEEINQIQNIEFWYRDMKQLSEQYPMSHRIFYVYQKDDKDKLELRVNTNDNIINSFKDIRNLTQAKIKIQNYYLYIAEDAKSIYSYSIILQEIVYNIQQQNYRIDEKLQKLIAIHKKELYKVLMGGHNITWLEKITLKNYVEKLSQKMDILEDAIQTLQTKQEETNQLIQEFKEANTIGMKEIIKKIQKIIDDFEFKNFSNLNLFVNDLNNQIENFLLEKLKRQIDKWFFAFNDYQKNIKSPIKDSLIHQLIINERRIQIEPSLEFSRSYWYKQLQILFSDFCEIPCLEHSRYYGQSNKNNFQYILNKIDLLPFYQQLEDKFSEVAKYVKTWFNYEGLFQMTLEQVLQALNNDVNAWNNLLIEIQEGRKTFDNSETSKNFGAIIVDYGQIQSSIFIKYDFWHKELLSKFQQNHQDILQNFYNTLMEQKRQLELINFSLLNDQTNEFIVAYENSLKTYTTWQKQIDNLKLGEQLLIKQKQQPKNESISVNLVETAWKTYKTIFNLKKENFEKERLKIKERIMDEEKSFKQQAKQFEQQWLKDKPVQTTCEIEQSIYFLNNFQISLQQLQKNLKGTQNFLGNSQSKELLKMDKSNALAIDGLIQEVQTLKQLWISFTDINTKLEYLRQSQVAISEPKKIKSGLDEILSLLDSFNVELKYFIQQDNLKFLYTKNQQFKIIKNNLFQYLILKMKEQDQNIKEKFIKFIQLLNILGIQKTEFFSLNLGQLWDADPLKYENKIKEIFNAVRGEQIIEKILIEIKDFWTQQEIETFKYQTKYRILKSWADIFTRCDEDIQNLETLKMSLYYKEFEEEISLWLQKIQFIRNLFDTWSNVQRKWIYLESIFNGPSDIKQQMPQEYDRFQQIDIEFLELMKQVTIKPQIIIIIALVGIYQTLERLLDQLNKIQKSLIDFLELQRQAFARFYFVGDQDLLEMIGNPKSVLSIQRHFVKMYAGLYQLNFNDNSLLGMISKEGEQVKFEKEILIQGPLNEWLENMDRQVEFTLALGLDKCLKIIEQLKGLEIISGNSGQLIILAYQIYFCYIIEQDIIKQEKNGQQFVMDMLFKLTQGIFVFMESFQRQKYEQIITDFVHHRDVARKVQNVQNVQEFKWQYFMRFYWDASQTELLKKCKIQMANVNRFYGFEYLGIGERLVQTPLTDKCYVTLTQALNMKLGGCPFGPAGTGKTESVKALGGQLGQFVLTFNCDETFDLIAMGRIFVGVCQVGAWGCFDEFNRLEERMLSAVSQQILAIQIGLQENSNKIDLIGKDVILQPTLGIFVTMNPGYAGRSNLPENLKQLFRQMAMVKPDAELIAQVTLYSQGYQTAEKLAGKIVSLFDLCKDQLSSQPHYDFGLRALKCVLISAGNLKRNEKQGNLSMDNFEQKILLLSLCNTIVPKLVQDDIPLMSSLLKGIFPGCDIVSVEEPLLIECVRQVCIQRMLIPEDNFLNKIIQLYGIQNMQHGIILVGSTGNGKTQAWRVLLEAMYMMDKIKGESYIIDPKAIIKDHLYGKMDNYTMEWQDGVFTSILRKIIENQKQENTKRHWILFDGDVDPEWAENLNSVLDDNRLLTLPNGERLSIPRNVKIIFEVETLKYATLATVSRCGMIWFSSEIINYKMIFQHYLLRLQKDQYDDLNSFKEKENDQIKERKKCISYIQKYFEEDSCFFQKIIQLGGSYQHVMTFTAIRVIESTFALIRKAITRILEYQESHQDNQISDEVIQNYMNSFMILALSWGVGGSINLKQREQFSRQIADIAIQSGFVTNIDSHGGISPIDLELNLENGEFQPWNLKVPQYDLDVGKVTDADLIISTVDTLRHQFILGSWMSEHRAFLICGPPGSGKTMTLMTTLKSLPECEMIFINFSSTTKPSMILTQFEHYCEYVKNSKGIILRPKNPNKWLVIFCDEINLPETDKYGTIPVITFLRQISEQNGFWRKDCLWVTIEKITFVGACNPPTDIGRSILSDRFLRHVPLLLVDYPGRESFIQIYGTFNRAMLKKAPIVRKFADRMTEAQIDVYMQNQLKFTAEIQPHYIYSPRELTRWKFAINEAIDTVNSLDSLVRLWAHEGLRLFHDRLVTEQEKEWCIDLIDSVAYKYFPEISKSCLEKPIYFSPYLNGRYVSVSSDDLKNFIEQRLQVFYEEVINVPIVVFSSVLDHILRIDRVLRQPLGHCLLVGQSGVGKTTLSRFVSWMNGLQVFQIKAGKNYGIVDFDKDLRNVMIQAGCKEQQISFIFDESNILSVAFMERMNALLASGEIPGLFENDEYHFLISQMREYHKNAGQLDDDQLYKIFIKQVQRNLHVVFTMNPAGDDFSDRGASSPALYNRCVIDWFGGWSADALQQVTKDYTKTVELIPDFFIKPCDIQQRQTNLIQTIVFTHESIIMLNENFQKTAKNFNYVTPRDFISFLSHFTDFYQNKNAELKNQYYHLKNGLQKLQDTQNSVSELKAQLETYKINLEQKQDNANIKLKLMVQKQKEAEFKKEETIQVKTQVIEKQNIANEKQISLQQELSQIIPMLESAQLSVQNISKSDINELQKYANPSNLIKKTMEAIIVFIKQIRKPMEWSDVKQEFNKPGFLQSVLQLDKDNYPDKMIKYVTETFINSPDWDSKKIQNASKVAGPLAIWLESQIKYNQILKKLEPLKNEYKIIQSELASLNQELHNKEVIIQELEKNLIQYQIDYAELIAEVQNIKSDMAKIVEKVYIQQQVTRSDNLLKNLSSEQNRWKDQSDSFKFQMASLLGDVLYASSFLSYIGYFDFYYRQYLYAKWIKLITSQNIHIRKDTNIISYLSSSSDLLKWQSNGLPNDNLCNENAIIIKKFKRYPLIIDPSGQCINFIKNLYAQDKLILTSFQDDNFVKNLETSLRFGRPLLIQDVERIDPILNPILNKELYKNGSRILIRVGDQEIDYQSSFQLFMITRDCNQRFTPDICSRVTFVNFTLTASSLQNQCLNIYLQNERPDIQKMQIQQLKLQGEFSAKLRILEEDLLNELSNSQGNILENENLISSLELLKKESYEVIQAINDSHLVMEQITEVTKSYDNLAQQSSKLYFTMQSLQKINILYDYSLQFFMDTLNKVLQSKKLQEHDVFMQLKDYLLRLQILSAELYQNIYTRISSSLKENDKFVFVLKMIQIKSDLKVKKFLNILIKPSQSSGQSLKHIFQDQLATSQLMILEEISKQDGFENIMEHIQKNKQQWIDLIQKDLIIPIGWEISQIYKDLTEKQQNQLKIIIECIIIRIFRPEKLDIYIRKLIEVSFETTILQENNLDLQEIIENQLGENMPLLMVSAPGFNASQKIEVMAKQQGKKFASIAIGGEQSFIQAKQYIDNFIQEGGWVLLKNVHLAPEWLSQLEKNLFNKKQNNKFKLFLSMEFNPKVPVSIIRQSYKVIFEPPSGIKASLLRTYTTLLSSNRTEKIPNERSKLHFLVAWTHAVIIERLRYIPIGWSKTYEFNEADLIFSFDLIDELINNQCGQSRTLQNIDIDQIPWLSIQVLLSQNVYGGKIDNVYDQEILSSIIQSIFTPKAFEHQYPLFQSQNTIFVPDAIKFNQFMDWINQLSDNESPEWCGLPKNVEKLIKMQQNIYLLDKMWEIQDQTEDQEVQEQVVQQKVKWIVDLGERVQKYQKYLPQSVVKIERNEKNIGDPIFRFLERETQVAEQLLNQVIQDLNSLQEMVNSDGKVSFKIKQIAKSLYNDIIPDSWKKYISVKLTVNEWIFDFSKRINQLNQIIKTSDFMQKGLWIGGLMFPEAFMTATRQSVAQKLNQSLEDLELKLQVFDGQKIDENSFKVSGLVLQGHSLDLKTNLIQISDIIDNNLPEIVFTWIKKLDNDVIDEQNKKILCPVYLNKSRSNLLFSVKMECGENSPLTLYQKGLAIIFWNN